MTRRIPLGYGLAEKVRIGDPGLAARRRIRAELPPRPDLTAMHVARDMRQRSGANYGDPTGTISYDAFDTGTVTLEGLAQRTAALIRDRKREGTG